MKDLIDRLRGMAPIVGWHTRQSAELLWEAANELERFRWIPVSQQPEAERDYLTLVDGKNCALDFWEQGSGWWGNGNRVTHWMNLPEKPE